MCVHAGRLPACSSAFPPIQLSSCPCTLHCWVLGVFFRDPSGASLTHIPALTTCLYGLQYSTSNLATHAAMHLCAHMPMGSVRKGARQRARPGVWSFFWQECPRTHDTHGS